MSDQSRSTAREVFAAATELFPQERGRFLAERCPTPVVLRQVEALLASHDKTGEFLSIPAAQLKELLEEFPDPVDGPASQETADPLVGAWLGTYRIISVQGVGGMGIVYRAEQESPRRAVALKVIRSMHAMPELLRRFRHEAQALGCLKHLGIAQILEAGIATDPSGRETPFFAMELVRGAPPREYAAALPIPRRLDLFALMCDAVHHAHQKGLIHRDLKPGNILVEEDEEAEVLRSEIELLSASAAVPSKWDLADCGGCVSSENHGGGESELLVPILSHTEYFRESASVPCETSRYRRPVGRDA